MVDLLRSFEFVNSDGFLEVESLQLVKYLNSTRNSHDAPIIASRLKKTYIYIYILGLHT